MAYDLAIVGAGPGGYVAAIRAAQLGASVALIERDAVGGVCLNRGCIPTKAMIASAHALEAVRRAGDYGVLDAGEARIDLARVQDRKDAIVGKLRDGIGQLLAANGVEVLAGTAAFDAAGTLAVDGEAIEAKRVLLATGSTWIDLPGLPIDGERIVTSDGALAWRVVPERLVIVGGGVIGCEFACMMAAFGSQVTIVEAMSQILPFAEGAIVRLLARSMKGRGIELRTKTTVERAAVEGDAVTVTLADSSALTADRVLVAVGRRPDTSALNLEAAGVERTDRGFVKVNEFFATTAETVFAIGDLVGPPMLAHAASAQGIACVERIFGEAGSYDARLVPSPIFTTPEIAGVGATAEELKELGIEHRTGRFPFAASGKALCDGSEEGQAIVHAAPDGNILGVHLYGAEATTLIAEATMALERGMTVEQLERVVHAHPTLPEVIPEAGLDALGRAIHKAPSRRRRST